MVQTPIKRKMATQKEKMDQPQSKHPVQGKKSIAIAIATVVLLLGLLSLMFFTDTFVGQAIHATSLTDGHAGFSFTGNPDVGESIPITANIGSDKTVAVGFVLQASEISCDNLVLTNSLGGWGDKVIEQNNCVFDSNTNTATFTFSVATMDPGEAKTGTFDVASLKFKSDYSDIKLEFAQFTIYKLGTTDDLVTPVGVDNVNVKPLITCTDTDNGKNYAEAGSVTNHVAPSGTAPTYDKCNGNDVLIEMYCDAEGKVQSEVVAVPKGKICKDGAFVAKKPVQPNSCTDPDAKEKNQASATKLTYVENGKKLTSVTDYCVDAKVAGKKVDLSNIVRENLCSGDEAGTTLRDAPKGTVCSKGALIPTCKYTASDGIKAGSATYLVETKITNKDGGIVITQELKTSNDFCVGSTNPSDGKIVSESGFYRQNNCNAGGSSGSSNVAVTKGKVCKGGVIVAKKPACVAKWSCTDFSDCSNDKRTRVCNQVKPTCTDVSNKPAESESCSSSTDEISFIVSEKDSKGISSIKAKTDKVSPLTELDITVTVKPSKTLAKNHILIVQVSYGLDKGGSSPRLVVYELRDALAKGASESLKFTHKLPEKATGDVKIEAFVWAAWPGSAKVGISNILVKKQERKHGIK